MKTAEILRRFIDAIPLSMHVINPEGRIVDVNRAFLIHFGRTREDVQGQPLKQVMNSMIYFDRGKMRADEPWELETPAALEVLKTHLPSSATFHQGQSTAMARPIMDEEGGLLYVVTTYIDSAMQEGLRWRQPEETRLLGKSPALLRVREILRLAARTDVTVLITGETGCGKEVAADELHLMSRRRDGNFVKVNCAAIPETLMESELFGYEKGAFTGALRNGKAGLMEAADGGTLLLDEIGELPLSMQAKLLRAIQERAVVRVGGVASIPVDIRIVATTNRDLVNEVAKGRFREDLYYRLNVVPMEMPPLRSRGEDIRLIGEYYLSKFCKLYHLDAALSEEAWQLLLGYRWPGNVRQLRNLMERVVVLSQGREVSAEQVREWLEPAPGSGGGDLFPAPDSLPELTLQEATDRLQAAMIRRALERYHSTYRAAEELGVSQSTLARKAKSFGLTAGEK